MRAGCDAMAAKYDALAGPPASPRAWAECAVLGSPARPGQPVAPVSALAAATVMPGESSQRGDDARRAVEAAARRFTAGRAPLGERLALRHVAVLVPEAVRRGFVHRFKCAARRPLQPGLSRPAPPVRRREAAATGTRPEQHVIALARERAGRVVRCAVRVRQPHRDVRRSRTGVVEVAEAEGEGAAGHA